MFNKINTAMLFAALVLIAFTAKAQVERVTNSDIINLSRAGLGKALIVQKIQTTESDFDTTTAKIIELKHAGVAEEVISEMLKAKSSPRNPVDAKPQTTPAPVAGKTPDSGGPKPSGAAKIKSDVNNFSDAPKSIVGEAKKMVAFIEDNLAKGESIDEAIANDFVELFSYSAALGIEKEMDKTQAIFNLAPVSYAFETARTDKQVGVSSSSNASTSKADKPSFARLLGFAIENGFVEKNVHDTVLTLSTTPAALFTIGAKDYQTAYENAGIFNKIGLSSSFNINNNQNPLLANATRGQLREFSVRYNFFDRSARSPEFQTIFNRDIAPQIRNQLNAVGQIKEFIDQNDKLRIARNAIEPEIKVAVKELTETSEFKALSAEKKREQLTNIILNFVKSKVVEKLQNEPTTLTDDQKTALRAKLNALLKTQKEMLFDVARQNLDKFYKGQQASVAYVNNRDPFGNYSELKFLYQRYGTVLKPLTMLLNGGISFYHKPDGTKNQQKVRDASFTASFEGKITSPWNEVEDLAPITYAFTGKYTRRYENKGVVNRKADLGNFQFLMNLPVFRGFALPLSVTYSNATEMERKSGFRFNFGFKLDTDKLFELANLSKALSR